MYLVEIGILNYHIPLGLIFITFYDVIGGQNLIALLAALVISDRPMVIFMQKIESDSLFRIDGIVYKYGYRH
jgi:hypothetical protein